MDWVWGWVGVVFHLNPVITLGTGAFFLAWGRQCWFRPRFRPNSEDLRVGHCTILIDRTGKRPRKKWSTNLNIKSWKIVPHSISGGGGGPGNIPRGKFFYEDTTAGANLKGEGVERKSHSGSCSTLPFFPSFHGHLFLAPAFYAGGYEDSFTVDSATYPT